VVDTLIDAGPLLATINGNDNWHAESAGLNDRNPFVIVGP